MGQEGVEQAVSAKTTPLNQFSKDMVDAEQEGGGLEGLLGV